MVSLGGEVTQAEGARVQGNVSKGFVFSLEPNEPFINQGQCLSCGKCIAVCPWNKRINAFHNLVRFVAIHSPAIVKKMLVRADVQVYGRTKKVV